jgi:hypothetical protein
VSIGPKGFGLSLDFQGELLAGRCKTLLGQVAQFFVGLFEAMPAGTKMTYCTALAQEPYPRVRPPRRSSEPLFLGALLDVIDVAEMRACRAPAEVDAVLGAPLPEGVSRTVHGGLAVIQWVDDVCDIARIGAARTQQEQWLVAHATLDRHPDFSPEGDAAEVAYDLEPHPPLTFYRVGPQVGYKAIVAMKDGSVDEGEWAEVRGWLERRQLPDGSPIAEMKVIVPLREGAVKLLDRAKRDGIGVLYPGDGQQFFDPSPTGEWVDEA